MTLTLLLKHKFLLEILSYKKTKEYRADSPYYAARLLNRNYKYILFICHNKRLRCEVISIKKRNNPFLHKNLSYLNTPKVWIISLKNPKLITVNQ